MNDIQDLKAIAERCIGHQPLRFMQSYGALYIRNDNGIVFDVHQNRSFPDFMAQNRDYADLVLAANPAAVLELFAEIERWRKVSAWTDGGANKVTISFAPLCAHMDERDNLKAENTDLHATLQAAKGEIERLKGVLAGMAELEAYATTPLRNRCAERKQLKAENEALRKALITIREESHDIGACECAADALVDSRKEASHG